MDELAVVDGWAGTTIATTGGRATEAGRAGGRRSVCDRRAAGLWPKERWWPDAPHTLEATVGLARCAPGVFQSGKRTTCYSRPTNEEATPAYCCTVVPQKL